MVRPGELSRKVGSYQGVLQLRNPTKELVDWVVSTTEKDGKATITFSRPVPGGIDLYYDNQRYLRVLGQKLDKQWPGELKMTRKLFTEDLHTGKKIYRVTVMFRLTGIKKGLKFKSDGEEYEISDTGKFITVKNTKTGKKEKWTKEQVMKNL